MSWWPDFTNVKASVFTEAIKKKACGFLLRRYGGNWLKEKAINLDQLTLDLYNGRAKFRNFELDVANINELLDGYSLPLEVVDCFVGSLDIFVPWAAIFCENSQLEIQNLEITLRHRARDVKESSLFDSMLYSSMTTSMKLAEECLKNENSEDKKPPSSTSMPYYEGLHDLACTVEAIFVKVKGTLMDTTICFEHLNNNYTTIFELKIARVDYFDDEVERTGVVAEDDRINRGEDAEERRGKKVCDLASVRSKNLIFQGVKLYIGIEKESCKSIMGRPTKLNNVDSILVGDFVGRHKLRVSFSQEQEANSVKMLIESQIEGINVVMCPQVLSYIHRICSDISASIAKDEPTDKSITSDDYEKIRKGIEAPSIPSGIGGGGRQSFASSGRDEIFQSMAPSSFTNSGFQSMESSLSSMMSSCSTLSGGGKQRGKVTSGRDKKPEEDRISSTEISLRVSFISFILLHDDTAHEGESWHDNLRSLEDKYLKVIRGMPLAGISNSLELIKLRKHFSTVLNRDHFSLMLKQLDMVTLLDNKDNCLRNKSFDLELTVGLADIAEAIVHSNGKGIDFCPWLMFEEGFLVMRDEDMTSIGRPSFKLKIEPLERESLMSRSSSSPFLVTLTTTKCSSELDVTVLNRIHSIVSALSPVASKQSLQQKDPTQSFLFNNEVEDERREKIAIALCSSCWICKIRFPKADLTEMSRQKRAGRHLHEDSLLFEIQKLNLKTELILMENEFQDFELYFMSAKGHLMTKSESHCLLHVSSNLFMKGQDDGFDWPRIKVRLSSTMNSVLGSGMNFPSKELDPMSASIYPMVAQGNRAPFSSKRRQFKNRELIEPGERSEMISFLDIEGNNSAITIDANLQQVLLFLPNKNVLELLYNRLLGDMLLWTPMSPANLPFDGSSAPPSLFVEQNLLFRSEMRSPSDENVHDNDDLDDLMKMETPEKQSRACVSIGVQEGRIVADVMESSQPRRFVLSLTDLAVPFVSSYHGDPLLHYFCMQASSLDLSHTATSDGHRGPSAYDIHARMDGRNWKKILQVNRDNLGLERPSSTRDMLSLTMMIKEESNQLVHYKLAVKLRNCSLMHVDTPRDELHWLFQLMELFSLVDYDIPGYQLPQSISELHFSLENCAVEYRPSFLPHHVLLFSESVHITSNAIPEAVGYKLNIWIEDTGLFISNRQTSKRIDLKRDFVCIADINSFDLSFKQLKEFNEKRPQTSLLASINRLHMRTCSDSFVALSQVIIHLANMGEFMQQANPCSNPTEEPQDVPVVMTEVKQMEVNKLLEDAINSEFTCRTDSPDMQLHRTLVSKFDERPVAYVFNSPLVSSQESLSSSFSDGSQDNAKSSEDANITRNNKRSPQDCRVAEKLNYIDNHFAKPTARSSAFESEDYPVPLEKYQLTDTSITWHIYGGNDFSPEFTSEFTDRRSAHKQKARKWQEVCGQARNHSVLVELQLNKVQLLHEVYPEGKRDLSRDVLFVREIEVLDRMEVSDINKFLHLYLSETLPKPINGNMIKISAHYVRPEESKDRKECMLRISLQPVKLNIDQDTLTFLTNFFTEVSNTAHKSFLPHSPKMSSDLDEDGEATAEMSPRKEAGTSYAPIFFSSVRFSPDVVIKIDYKGKRVEQGTLVGLLVGLTQLNQSQIVLKKISYKRGLLGVDKVAEYMFNEWVKDIRTNQLSGLLRGVGPMNSFFQFVQGVRDLFWMPVEQYRKDGRIMRGIQRGTYSFASCTAISALELTNKLFNTILFIAEAAHDIVSPGTNTVHDRKRGANKRQRQPKQPEDLREGVTMACGVVREGLHNRATELMDVVAKEHEQRGVTGAIGEMIRQIPPTVIEPIIVASKATSNVLGGVRNQLMPDMRKEDLEKWKTK